MTHPPATPAHSGSSSDPVVSGALLTNGTSTDAAEPAAVEMTAHAAWRAIDFISDLHLQATDAVTVAAWAKFLHTTDADALFILGDLFEVWIGDDAAVPGSFEAQCADLLLAASQRMPIFFMHGNRDFLLGTAFLQQSGMVLLHDPTALAFHSHRVLLSHGDALCVDDVDYMRFRRQVRDPQWQAAVLARPIAERRALARNIRGESEARKGSEVTYADADDALVRQWLAAARAPLLLHGHTHRPALHALGERGGQQLQRMVLSDWDATSHPPRLEVLRLDLDHGWRRLPLTTD